MAKALIGPAGRKWAVKASLQVFVWRRRGEWPEAVQGFGTLHEQLLEIPRVRTWGAKRSPFVAVGWEPWQPFCGGATP